MNATVLQKECDCGSYWKIGFRHKIQRQTLSGNISAHCAAPLPACERPLSFRRSPTTAWHETRTANAASAVQLESIGSGEIQVEAALSPNCDTLCLKALRSRLHKCLTWSYGVTVSTLDSESSDRNSNPRRTFPCALQT